MGIAVALVLGGVVALCVWAIDAQVDQKRNTQIALDLALAYRDHMTTARCSISNAPIELNTVRVELANAGQQHPAIDEEVNWRVSFDGGANRQHAVTVFKMDSGAISQSTTFQLPVSGGDRSVEFFDAVFDSRDCP